MREHLRWFAMEEHTEQTVAVQEPAEKPDIHFEPVQFTTAEFLLQIVQGIGIALGLLLLGVMEKVRNVCFRLLDRLNVKPRRHRRVSAFPPGKHQRPRPEAGVRNLRAG